GAPASGPAPTGDAQPELARRIAALDARGGGTLELGDGTYLLSQPLILPLSVSLSMSPRAVLRAQKDFNGDALLIKGGGKYPANSSSAGWIRGGVLDGARLALTGIRVEKLHRLEIADLEIQDAAMKGIHLARGGNETNLSRVRINLSADLAHAPGSIGVHYERGDCKASQVHIIGYETGIRDDWGSNWFHLIHAWNTETTQGPLKVAFDGNGGNSHFHMCYADSPTVAGFAIRKPNHTVVQCSVYYSRWAPEGGGAAFLLGPRGRHGTFLANDVWADEGHRLGKAFDGDLSSQTILGTRYANVLAGAENRIASGEDTPSELPKIKGPIRYPSLQVGGGGLRLAPAAKAPTPEEGELGELRWIEEGSNSALWVKTGKGWKSAKLG
ncbi:MAG: hypothetical protein J0L75_04370, partial [Spirochaetes bacterium]|nr:hypothetical protein [Spirochaetota bacterium]